MKNSAVSMTGQRSTFRILKFEKCGRLKLRPIWEDLNDRYLEQHVDWMHFLDHHEQSRSFAFELRDESGFYAYALVQQSWLSQVWEVRGIPLCKRSVETLRIVRGIVSRKDVDCEDGARALCDLIILLHHKFPDMPICLDALRPEPDGRIVAGSVPILSRFLLLRPRSDLEHHIVQLPKPPATYVEQLAPKDRQNVRRHTRRLYEHCDGDVQLVRYTGVSDVEKFLDVALPIARTTYQYRAYSAGLANQHSPLERYQDMARRGWWRGNLLYCKGEAVAFQVGCQIANTYFAEEIGYNPLWAPWSVGIFAMVHRIELLILEAAPPERCDFGPGDHDYKKRLGTCSWLECNYDLVPRNPKVAVPFVALHAAQKGTNAVRAAVKRVGMMSRKQRFLRRAKSTAGTQQ